jgi:hypothetical protein
MLPKGKERWQHEGLIRTSREEIMIANLPLTLLYPTREMKEKKDRFLKSSQ